MAKKKKAQDMHTDERENPQASEDSLEVLEGVAEIDVEALQQEIQDLRTKADEYLDGWQRSRAEFANYKKRMERDQALAYQSAAASIFKRFLEVLDDLDRALVNRPLQGEGAAWAEGIDLVYRKFYAILEAEGVNVMEAEGEFFDPNLHEAITQEDSDEHESGQVIAVVKNGYMIGDKVLRPALVRVAR